LAKENSADIEHIKNAVIYGKRGLFIRKRPVDLYGYPAFAYIVCDPVRRGTEISKKILSLEDDKDRLELQNCGLMILVSDMDLDIKEVVPLYYARQAAEQLFGIAKDDLNILPLRIHSETSFRGLMLLSFIALIVYLKLKKLVEPQDTVERLLLLMRHLKCKVYPDNSIIVSEVAKEQRLLFEKGGILVPKKGGI
jgi:transposase